MFLKRIDFVSKTIKPLHGFHDIKLRDSVLKINNKVLNVDSISAFENSNDTNNTSVIKKTIIKMKSAKKK